MKIIALITGICLFISCSDRPESKNDNFSHNQLSNTEVEDGWILLFDGETTSGWTNYGVDTIGSDWQVIDGMLHLDVSEKSEWQSIYGGDIVTDDTYSNFHLKLEWKISPGGNSGIMFHVQEDTVKYKYPWLTGPEMQILDDEAHPDGKISSHNAGDLYDLISSTKPSANPVGEWNQAAILVQNEHLDLYLNGINVVSTPLWDTTWTNLINESKFIDMPDFGTFKEGKIALQDHGDPVWFRNIKIKKL